MNLTSSVHYFIPLLVWIYFVGIKKNLIATPFTSEHLNLISLGVDLCAKSEEIQRQLKHFGELLMKDG